MGGCEDRSPRVSEPGSRCCVYISVSSFLITKQVMRTGVTWSCNEEGVATDSGRTFVNSISRFDGES